MEQLILSDESISERIFVIRGVKVMLDKDLAEMYGVKPIRLREQVKRNISRFPSHFMFQLSDEEVDFMVSQFAIPSRKHLGGTLPYVFSEHGILMLANVLKSEQAIKVSIKIIEVFIKIRELITANQDLMLKMERLENLVASHDNDIQSIILLIKDLIKEESKPRVPIGFKIGN